MQLTTKNIDLSGQNLIKHHQMDSVHLGYISLKLNYVLSNQKIEPGKLN